MDPKELKSEEETKQDVANEPVEIEDDNGIVDTGVLYERVSKDRDV